MKHIILYFLIINVLSIIITVLDKRFAIKHKWRIPEKLLFAFSILGGSVSMFLTMKIIHHKTKKKEFMIGIPIIILIQIAIIIYLVVKHFYI